MTLPCAQPGGDSPLDEFSHCHDGILGQLGQLAGLPALLGPAQQARRVAASALSFFRAVVFEHHAEEEAELFTAVLASAAGDTERRHVRSIVQRLSDEHRRIEAAWSALEPALKRVAKGQDAQLDGAAIEHLVQAYRAHANYEEQVLLPLAKTILGRNDNHMAALGLSLHLRHAVPQLLQRARSMI